MQVCTSLKTDNHASTHHSVFLQAGRPSCRPTNSVKALEGKINGLKIKVFQLIKARKKENHNNNNNRKIPYIILSFTEKNNKNIYTAPLTSKIQRRWWQC